MEAQHTSHQIHFHMSPRAKLSVLEVAQDDASNSPDHRSDSRCSQQEHHSRSISIQPQAEGKPMLKVWGPRATHCTYDKFPKVHSDATSS